MPGSAILDAPETAGASEHNAGQQPLTAPIPPELQSLMERVLPIEADRGNAEPNKPNTENPAGDTKPDAPEKTTLRLAPDLTEPGDEKPDVEKPAPDLEITDEMIAAEKNPKKQGDMRKFRETLEHYKQENARLKATPPAKTDDLDTQAVIERQNQHIADLSSRLERQNLMEHPIFKERFIQPRQQMFGQAIEIVKEIGGDPEAFERTMALPGKTKIAALDDMLKDVDSPVMRDRLGRLIDGIESKDREIAAALKDSKVLSENLSRQEKIQRHEMLQRQEQQLKSLLGAARRNLTEGLETPEGEKLQLEVLTKTGKADFKWWDDQADDIIATSEEILLKATPEKMAVASVLAASAGAYRSMWQAERHARNAAEARLAKIEDVEPGAEDRGKLPKAGEGEFAPDADITQVALTRLRRGDFNKT